MEPIAFLADDLTRHRIGPLRRWSEARVAVHEQQQRELDAEIERVIAEHNAALEADGSPLRLRVLGHRDRKS